MTLKRETVKLTNADLRKHIKPFLLFALKEYIKHNKIWGQSVWGLCHCSQRYSWSLNIGNVNTAIIHKFLCKRLEAARPKDVRKDKLFWYNVYDKEGVQKRIAFCKLQLKIVKP